MLPEYIVLDIETTGLSRDRHKITELAAVKVKDGEIVEEFQTLVNPEQHIPAFITSLTGISNEMVKDAPKIDKALPDFLNFLGNNVIIGHNVTFDYRFIEHNAQKIKKDFKNQRLCTRKLANRIYRHLPSKSLGYLCEYFDIKNLQAHRALTDVLATTELFQKFLNILQDNEITNPDALFHFEKLSPIKCAKIIKPVEYIY